MMRHQTSLALGLATLFVLPASLPGAQEPINLEERLEATIAAIEHLGGIDRRLHAGHEGLLSELLRATETPSADPVRRDATLTLLRAEVSALRQRWDEMSISGSPLRPGSNPLPLPTDGGDGSVGTPTHIGLDPSSYTRVHTETQPRVQVTDPDALRGAEELRSYENEEDYSADAVRQGQLLTRAKRWNEALEILLPHEAAPEVRYWIARCYGGLGRDFEAIVLLQDLMNAGEANAETGEDAPIEAQALARRATYDLNFLELRRELADRKKEKGK